MYPLLDDCHGLLVSDSTFLTPKKAMPIMASSSLPLFFFSLLLSSLFCWSHQTNNGGPVGEEGVGEVLLGGKQREFDYFVLALQWPGTICQRTRHCCASNGCCNRKVDFGYLWDWIGAIDLESFYPIGDGWNSAVQTFLIVSRPNGLTEFTIHGLWANYNDGTWPACCTKSKFDIKEISPLLSGLKKHWPSLSCSSPSTCHGTKGLFWAHESCIPELGSNMFPTLLLAEKHGTCSLSVFRDEYSYFLTTLNVYFKYNVTEILREAGYVPSNLEKYPLGGIISAIENAVRATPTIVCSNGAIEELRLCFYKDFKRSKSKSLLKNFLFNRPRDCTSSTTLQGVAVGSRSCPRYVSLLDYKTLGLGGRNGVLRLPDSKAI
ncbi:hypothetical protein GIB67_027864 [Kingdonia uniflora]|uniref:Uncharacterized protein n=1 Tax=Kingdonia uniflora TaxID=39325 RepID=A0A7J7L4E7_9MAGN|nr:hypothetical protein GIB67_027864 [Kingdonia uniflora]